MSKEYLLSRGKCCGNVCKNCPYFPKYTKESKRIYNDPKNFWGFM